MATGNMILAYVNVSKIKRDMPTKVEHEAVCQHIYDLCILDKLKYGLLMEHFNLLR